MAKRAGADDVPGWIEPCGVERPGRARWSPRDLNAGPSRSSPPVMQ